MKPASKVSTYLSATMSDAKSLQARYDRLGAPGTQNVRNPIPMKDLVLTALPTIPHPKAVITVTRTVTATVNGKTYRKQMKATAHAGDVLPDSTWKNAPTVEEVAATLTARGFFAKLGSVRTALHIAHYRSGVNSMRFTRPRTAHERVNGLRRNSSFCRYFLPANV